MIHQITEKIKGAIKDIYWRIYCRNLKNPQVKSSVSNLLFVCKGNVCRSPFAEYYAKSLLGDESLSVVTSAGLDVMVPAGAPQEALAAAEDFGVRFLTHTSKQIVHGMIRSADMILVMEASQFEELRQSFPDEIGKIFLLPLFDTDDQLTYYSKYNIYDPFGKTVTEFKDCYVRIVRCVNNVFQVTSPVKVVHHVS